MALVRDEQFRTGRAIVNRLACQVVAKRIAATTTEGIRLVGLATKGIRSGSTAAKWILPARIAAKWVGPGITTEGIRCAFATTKRIRSVAARWVRIAAAITKRISGARTVAEGIFPAWEFRFRGRQQPYLLQSSTVDDDGDSCQS